MAEPAAYTNERVIDGPRTSAVAGRVVWSPVKTLWHGGMVAGWLVGGTLFFSWEAVGLFLAASAVTLCGGHSLGMHRKLIHGAFRCPDWLERTGVYLGTLVGLGGPFTMMKTHDLRDWAQRQGDCHDYFAHRQPLLTDGFWQLHCALVLDRPPGFRFPAALERSRFYRFVEATHMAQQLPWALLFLALGGWGWVAWGVCGRVAVSMTGHWFVGWFAHNRGPRRWHVKGAAVQGHDVRFAGLVTFGEGWHNNHHAFPGSARLGLYPGQADPGWWVLRALERIGLVSALRQPADLPPRPELLRIA